MRRVLGLHFNLNFILERQPPCSGCYFRLLGSARQHLAPCAALPRTLRWAMPIFEQFADEHPRLARLCLSSGVWERGRPPQGAGAASGPRQPAERFNLHHGPVARERR